MFVLESTLSLVSLDENNMPALDKVVFVCCDLVNLGRSVVLSDEEAKVKVTVFSNVERELSTGGGDSK